MTISRERSGLVRWRVPLGFATGAAALWLAHPTWSSLAAGAAVAASGESVRLWAAGHLEKNREVTSSGPYRWVRHPLYVGSAIMGVGIAIAAADLRVAALVALYVAVVMTAAVRHEEAWLAERFGGDYRDYSEGPVAPAGRPFSWHRALVTNREYRAAFGLLIAALLLAVKAALA
jgi:protein-S-isoprenylcysteine O-methyltransferase Ste14